MRTPSSSMDTKVHSSLGEIKNNSFVAGVADPGFTLFILVPRGLNPQLENR